MLIRRLLREPIISSHTPYCVYWVPTHYAYGQKGLTSHTLVQDWSRADPAVWYTHVSAYRVLSRRFFFFLLWSQPRTRAASALIPPSFLLRLSPLPSPSDLPTKHTDPICPSKCSCLLRSGSTPSSGNRFSPVLTASHQHCCCSCQLTVSHSREHRSGHLLFITYTILFADSQTTSSSVCFLDVNDKFDLRTETSSVSRLG